jgi:transcriptional regulator with XRE-family HTH domain
MARQQHDSGGTELGRFLRARRSQVTPADVGFTPGAGARRTPGLRREEVAALAGVSIDYYTRLQRGKETRPSPAVTDALARALKLDPDEHERLRALAARAARYAPEPPAAPSRTVRPQLKLLLESLRPNPAYITSRTLDLLAANPGAMALYAGIGDWPAAHRNIGRFLFLHPVARDIYADWDNQIRGCVARCAPWPEPTPMPRTWPPSSASSCSKARTSPSCGNATTSPAAPPRRARPSTTPRSARSPSASRTCGWRAPLASASASTSPSPGPPTTTP